MKVIYLASFQAHHPEFDVTYQDINGKRDIGGDMMDVDLTPYDVIIATPPCNFYSRAAGARKPSQYAIDTAHLLPDILKRLRDIGKPYIVENVINYPKMRAFIDQEYVYYHGRHTYWTNIPFNPLMCEQLQDFKTHGQRLHTKTQGGQNVHNVIDYWLEVVKDMYFKK